MVNNLITIFKSEVYHANDIREDINSLVLKKLKEEKDLNYKNTKSNVGGFQTKLLPIDNKLKNFISEHVVNYLKNFKLKKECKRLEVDVNSFWINENNHLNFNILHTHMGAGVDFSGVYYIKCAENSGNIGFYDSNHQGTTFANVYEGFNEYYWIDIKEGDFLLFPSSYKHMVGPNLSNQNRVSISFNLIFNSKLDG